MANEVEEFVQSVYGWGGCVRPGTLDLSAIKEIYVEDVYRAKAWMNGTKVLDLGANIGIFSVWAIQQGAKKVVSLECCVETFDLLRRNTVDYPTIAPVHAAIGAQEGACNSVFLGEEDAHRSYAVVDDAGPVKMHSLNSLIGDDTYGFMKVDVEGMEWEIFQAVDRETMQRIDHIAIEFHGTDCPGAFEQPPGAFGNLIEKLTETHCVHTLGQAALGGYIYADVF